MIFPSNLIAMATGPAYFIAECGEMVSWIGAALHSTSRNGGYCTPLIKDFRVDALLSDSASPKHIGYCEFDFEFTQPDTSDHSLLRIQNLTKEFAGGKATIQGFPIRRRPDGYLGLEFSFSTLLLYFDASGAEIYGKDVLVKGLERVLKLVKHTEDIFLWQLDSLLIYFVPCLEDQHNQETYLDHHSLENGRHFLDEHTYDAAFAKGTS
jgi:hypothetical protein